MGLKDNTLSRPTPMGLLREGICHVYSGLMPVYLEAIHLTEHIYFAVFIYHHHALLLITGWERIVCIEVK